MTTKESISDIFDKIINHKINKDEAIEFLSKLVESTEYNKPQDPAKIYGLTNIEEAMLYILDKFDSTSGPAKDILKKNADVLLSLKSKIKAGYADYIKTDSSKF